MTTTVNPTPFDTGTSEQLLLALQENSNTPPLLVIGGKSIELPERLAVVFKNVFEDFSQGRPISIISHDSKMTTQQLADFLGVSRPTAIKLLKQFNIPIEYINKHRRVQFGDVQKLQKLLSQRQRTAIRELNQLENELGLLEKNSDS